MTYSFDIFDTCLVRKCGEPCNVFDILAQKAFTTNVNNTIKRAFVVARLEAGTTSYSEKQNLSDIYDAFHFNHFALKSKSELKNLEMDIEKEMIIPVKRILEFVNSIRLKGHRILFVSDMYLGTDFLKNILSETGFYQSGDSLYVSCDCGATKSSGELFKYIAERENIKYREWHHYGDNRFNDIMMPKKLGIHVHKVNHSYTPYQQNMQLLPSLSFQWGSIMAGLSRSLRVQGDCSPHKDFVLDIIAPLYVSFVCRVMSDAQIRGFDTLYFCARDAYPLYRIARKMKTVYSKIDVQYLYISRKSLYEGDDNIKLDYFRQCGLASRTKHNAIVDMRSTGKTLSVLNEMVSSNGFLPIYGYYFEIIEQLSDKLTDCVYTELYNKYLYNSSKSMTPVVNNWYLYEFFFPLNIQQRTIGYRIDDKTIVPIFEEEHEEFKFNNINIQEIVTWRNMMLDGYVDGFIQLGLYQWADDIFMYFSMPQLSEFFTFPSKHYLRALNGFYGMCDDKSYKLYIDDSIIRLPMNIIKHRTLWKRGTIFYSLPNWFCRFVYKVIARL